MMRKFFSLNKYCERFFIVTSFFFSEEKASESRTGIEAAHNPLVTGTRGSWVRFPLGTQTFFF